MKNTQIKNNYGGKQLLTPFGVFQSIKQCSRVTGLNSNTIKYRAQNNIMGYSFNPESDI
jgi:hypothetical protein